MGSGKSSRLHTGRYFGFRLPATGDGNCGTEEKINSFLLGWIEMIERRAGDAREVK